MVTELLTIVGLHQLNGMNFPILERTEELSVPKGSDRAELGFIISEYNSMDIGTKNRLLEFFNNSVCKNIKPLV